MWVKYVGEAGGCGLVNTHTNTHRLCVNYVGEVSKCGCVCVKCVGAVSGCE